jgi:hypothetical protein
VPAAAVIPAPIAYIKVVAVKKLVVGSQSLPVGPPLNETATSSCTTAYQLVSPERADSKVLWCSSPGVTGD